MANRAKQRQRATNRLDPSRDRQARTGSTDSVLPRAARTHVIEGLVRVAARGKRTGLMVALVRNDAQGQSAVAEAAVSKEGRFRFRLTREQVRGDHGRAARPYYSFRVLDATKQPLLDSQRFAIWKPTFPRVPIRLDLAATRAPGAATTLDDVWLLADRRPASATQRWLRDNKIETLADLRKDTVLEQLARRRRQDPSAELLLTLAGLSVVDAPANVYLRLAKEGFRHARAVADASLAELARVLDGETGRDEIMRIQAEAAQADWRSSNVILLKRMTGGPAMHGADELAARLRLTCRCDCASATSAQAYLSHLLRVAVRVLRYQNRRVDLGLLQTRLRQPFRDLPATCESSEKEIAQARIAIDVLRAHFTDAVSRAWYLEAAYLAGLEYLGLTYDELRRAMASGDLGVKAKLVQFRGLGVGALSDGQLVDDLYRDLPAPGGAFPLTEDWLQETFGLRSTLIAPLDPDPDPVRAVQIRRRALRARWLAADSGPQRPLGEIPIVDPHLVDEVDVVNRVPTTPRIDDPQRWTPIDMLKRRQEEWLRVGPTIAAFFGTPPAGTTRAQRLKALFDELAQPVFMVTLPGSAIPLPPFGFRAGTQALDYARLESLYTSLQQGADVSADLALFGIDEDTVRLFVDYAQHVETGPVTAAETAAFTRGVESHIKRVGFWPEWLRQERANATGPAGNRLTLSPEMFRLRIRGGDTADPQWLPRPGLAEPAERARWEELLLARTRQLDDLGADLQRRLVEIEARLLPELRDDLIRSARADAEALTDQFQVDFKAGGCQRTTRVTQAIQTLHGILLGARSGLLDELGWTLLEPEFDEIWKWVGTYEAWRAAITAFLNPERLLRASFIQDTSPGLTRALDILRDADPITAVDGRRAHDALADYLNDVATLEIAAGAERPLATEPGAGERRAIYLLARPKNAGDATVYASVVIEQRNTLGDQSWWRPVTPMKAVDQIFGLATCGKYVVALTASSTAGVKRLEAWRQPLADASIGTAEFLDEDAGWEGPFDLPLPPNVDGFDAVAVRPAAAVGVPPTVVIEADEQSLFLRQLNDEANGWSGRFRRQANSTSWTEIGESAAPVANNATFACLGNGSTGDTADERYTFAADVDADGADEIIAFPGTEGFWSMKLFAVGTRQIWRPMTARGTEIYDNPIPARIPSGGSLWFTFGGDFDGDDAAEVVAIINTTPFIAGGARNNILELYSRKWNTPTSGQWNPMGNLAAQGDLLDYAHPYLVPQDGMVGRFTQALRDEIALTFYPTQTGRSHEIVVFGFVNGAWKVAATTLATSFVPGGITADSRATAGRFSGQARSEILIQQGGATSNLFLMLTFNVAANAWQRTATLNVGSVATEPRMLTGDFDDDGADELALTDGGTLVRFFKLDGQRWAAMGQVDMNDPVAAWATGDVDGDGRVNLLVTTAASPSSGWVVRWNIDQNRAEIQPQAIDLTLGTGRLARGLVTGRYGKAGRSDVASLADGTTFYALTKQPRALIRSTIPDVASFKPVLLEPFSLFHQGGLVHRADGTRELISSAQFTSMSGQVFAANAANRRRNRLYAEEACYFLIMEIALRLQAAADYLGALAWMRLVARLKGSTLDVSSAFLALDQLGQLPPLAGAHHDPLDAHAIARWRPGSYTRYTVEAMVRLLAAYGEAEYALATSESIPFARELFVSALALLKTHPYAATLDACESLIESVLRRLDADPTLRALIPDVRAVLEAENDVGRMADLSTRLLTAIAGATSSAQAAARVQAILAEPPAPASEPLTFAELLEEEDEATVTLQLQDPGLVTANVARGHFDASALIEFANNRRKLPFPQYAYCIPPSATLIELKRRIELNLSRLRNCQDITGSDLVFLPIGAEAPLSPANAWASMAGIPPLPYRYGTLIQRAKELVEIARQIESSMLAFVETAERKRYDVLAARRDLSLARASQQLRSAQVQQAVGEVGLATLQRDRADDQVGRYVRLLRAGLSVWEQGGLVAQWGAFGMKQMAAVATAVEEASFAGWFDGVFTWGAKNTRAITTAQGEALSALASVQFSQAQFERRQQSWGFNLEDARRDRQIGEQQIQIAGERLRAAQIERRIADLQSAYATDAVNLLTTKSFANEALYEWMASVLEGIYRYFLQQATTLARQAELRLAFERQELTVIVKRDYWTPRRGGATPDITSIPNGSDSVKGLTGAARLLRDIYQLDQFAFTRNRRKQLLTERVSLSRHDPVAFEELRATGRMVFDTPRELFDRRTPGYYLRLIQRVRVTVVALVPPTDGYRATLSNSGTSRVVIPSDGTFQDVTLQRGYEQCAYTSNAGAPGQTELDLQPELLAPFEGGAVDTRWLLELPLAANTFDRGSLADVVVTIDYTALFDDYLKVKTLGELPPTVARERVFSLRHQFPDAWYELHNPDAATTPLQTTFRTVREDFPPNLDNLRMTQITLLVRRRSGPAAPVTLDFLGFAAGGSGNFLGGAAATEANGLASTRRANGASWVPILAGPRDVAGDWRIRFATGHRSLFVNDELDDVLLSISVEGATTPGA